MNIREALYKCMQTEIDNVSYIVKLFTVNKNSTFAITTYIEAADVGSCFVTFSNGTKIVSDGNGQVPYYKISYANILKKEQTSNIENTLSLLYSDAGDLRSYYCAYTHAGHVKFTIKKDILYGNFEELLSSDVSDNSTHVITTISGNIEDGTNTSAVENNNVIIASEFKGYDESSKIDINTVNAKNITGDIIYAGSISPKPNSGGNMVITASEISSDSFRTKDSDNTYKKIKPVTYGNNRTSVNLQVDYDETSGTLTFVVTE